MIDLTAPLPLRNPIKHYAWGTRGENALIPDLVGIPADHDTPYAELWIGAHASAPSEVPGRDGQALDALIAAEPVAILGERCVRLFGPNLPYMLKVLCVSRPLSVQVHPGRALAAELHRTDRAAYPDPHAKSEVVVALDSFTALVGFQNGAGVDRFLRRHRYLAELVDEETRRPATAARPAAPARAELLRATIAALGRRQRDDPGWVARLTDDLAARLAAGSQPPRPEEEVFLRLRSDRPHAGPDEPDVGLLLVLLMNVVQLTEGQAVEVGPGVPHAYLAGNAVECLSNSDNVVRAGLTDKAIDIETFAQAVRLAPRRPRVLEPSAGQLSLYETTSPEFRLCRHELSAGQSHELPDSGPRLVVVVEGSVRLDWGSGPRAGALPVDRGGSFLLPDPVRAARVQAETDSVLFTASVP